MNSGRAFPATALANSSGVLGEDLADEFVGLVVVSVEGPPLLGGVELSVVVVVSDEGELLAVDRPETLGTVRFEGFLSRRPSAVDQC